jgi:hypothetical protein
MVEEGSEHLMTFSFFVLPDQAFNLTGNALDDFFFADIIISLVCTNVVAFT